MNQITVLFFASLKDHIGAKKVILEIPDQLTVRDLKMLLLERYPAISDNLPTVLVSVNQQFAFDQEVIPAGAEVGLFPPVSGGKTDQTTYVLITEDNIDLDQLIEKITYPTTGAACVFTGMVRGQTSRRHHYETIALEYEAYKPMAELKMSQVAQEIRSHWPNIEGIVIVQRIGRLMPGTPTVLIACSAAHRDTGIFEAAHYGIDRLKEIVPVWKKEISPEGEVWQEGDYHPTPLD